MKQNSTRAALTRLSENGSAGVRRMLDKLVRSDPRMAHAREATTREATQEIITRLWLAHLKVEHRALAESNNPQEERRRLEIKMRLKVLERPKSPEDLAEALSAELALFTKRLPPVAAEPSPVAAEPMPLEATISDTPLPARVEDLPEEEPF